MKNGKCPKCKSTNVYTKDWGLESRKISGRSQMHSDYICTDCGYVESYYTRKEVLRNISEGWKKVN